MGSQHHPHPPPKSGGPPRQRPRSQDDIQDARDAAAAAAAASVSSTSSAWVLEKWDAAARRQSNAQHPPRHGPPPSHGDLPRLTLLCAVAEDAHESTSMRRLIDSEVPLLSRHRAHELQAPSEFDGVAGLMGASADAGVCAITAALCAVSTTHSLDGRSFFPQPQIHATAVVTLSAALLAFVARRKLAEKSRQAFVRNAIDRLRETPVMLTRDFPEWLTDLPPSDDEAPSVQSSETAPASEPSSAKLLTTLPAVMTFRQDDAAEVELKTVRIEDTSVMSQVDKWERATHRQTQ
eukprot:Rhum_TRINITY_DN5841_c0_g2::Rhum_TRINITY_DN5841_c0_g2_i1::g.18508::m.18508